MTRRQALRLLPAAVCATSTASAQRGMTSRNVKPVTVGDFDNDGYDDVFITCWGQNLLFHNNGDGTFSEITEKAGLLHQGNQFGSGCTWIDYDRDGRLDLFICHYAVFDRDKIPVRGK